MTLTTSLVLDIIAAALVILFTVIGMRRGFIKSVVRLLGFVVAIVVSALASTPIAQWLYDTFLHAQVEATVALKVEETVTSAATSLADQVNAVLAALPNGVQNLLSIYGVDAVGMTGNAQSTDALVTTVMSDIITPLCVAILQLAAFLVLFLLLFLVIRLLGKVIDKVFASIPVIKQINGLLGGVLGFAEGVLILFVACFGLQLYMTLTGANSLITMEHITGTYLLETAMNLNPIL